MNQKKRQFFSKKNFLSSLLFGLFFYLLLASSVKGQVEIISGLQDNKILFEVDYRQLGEEDEETEFLNYSQELIFQNKGEKPEELLFTFVQVPSSYQLDLLDENQSSLLETTFLIEPNETKKAILTVQVPINEDSGSHSLGELKILGSSSSFNPLSIEAFVQPMLKIDKIKVRVSGTDQGSLTEGEEISNVPPAKEVTLEFILENLFDEDYVNGDIDHAELSLDFLDADDEEDFDGEISEEVEDIKIKAGEKLKGGDAVTIKFKVPPRAKEKKKGYPLVVKLTGKDDNKAKHTVEWIIYLEVDRQKDDVRLEKAYLINPSLPCGATEAFLKIKLTNFGSNDQDEVLLKIFSQSKELKLNQIFSDIYLDADPDEEENSYHKTFVINTQNVKAGTYPLTVEVYVDTDEKVDSASLSLTIEECPKKASDFSSSASCQAAGFFWYEGACHEEEKKIEVITSVCGNGIIEANEECDDNNTFDGDGCSSFCKIEKLPLPPSEEVLETTEIPFTQIKGVVILLVIIIALLIILIVLVGCSLRKNK